MLVYLSLILAALILMTTICQGQTDPGEKEDRKISRIIKQDGNVFVGEILQDDGREVLILTDGLGKIYIPKSEIKEIEEVGAEEFRQGTFIGRDRFASRYFLTTNGLPIVKGEHYGMLSAYGPEVHFAASDNLSVGLLTTWIAAPIVASVKYSINLAPKANLSLGVLGGGMPFFVPGLGVLGYGAFTLGDRSANLTLSAGYAGITDTEGGGSAAPLLSIAGAVKTSPKFSLVGDSFIFLGQSGDGSSQEWALIMPGFRYAPNSRGALQLGVGGLVVEGELLPFPIPTGTIFLSLN